MAACEVDNVMDEHPVKDSGRYACLTHSSAGHNILHESDRKASEMQHISGELIDALGTSLCPCTYKAA